MATLISRQDPPDRQPNDGDAPPRATAARHPWAPAPRVTIRLDFVCGSRVGHGKIELLERIADAGSIARAAHALHMSYPRALALLAQIDASLGQPAAIRSAGGARGGGAALTDAGRDIVQRYRAVEAAAQRYAETL